MYMYMYTVYMYMYTCTMYMHNCRIKDTCTVYMYTVYTLLMYIHVQVLHKESPSDEILLSSCCDERLVTIIARCDFQSPARLSPSGYTTKENKKKKDTCTYMYMYMYMCIHTLYMYMYMYIRTLYMYTCTCTCNYTEKKYPYDCFMMLPYHNHGKLSHVGNTTGYYSYYFDYPLFLRIL